MRWFQWLDNREQSLDNKGRVSFGAETMDAVDKPARVRAHFDSVASRYDFMNTLFCFGLHYRWKKRSVDLLELKKGEVVLDVCGGTGDLIHLAVEELEGKGRFMVCDFTRSMLEVGRRKRAGSAAGRIDWIQGDAESIPLRDRSVDAAMIGFGIRNLTTPSQGIEEMHRVLKPGGRLLCLEFSKPVNPVFCRLYDVYSLTVMPLMARVIAGSGLPYTRLAETIRLFPAAEELGRLFQEEGFRRLACLNLTNGIAAAHLVQKADSG